MLVCFGECSLGEFHLPSQSAPSTLVFKKLGLFEDLKTTDYIGMSFVGPKTLMSFKIPGG